MTEEVSSLSPSQLTLHLRMAATAAAALAACSSIDTLYREAARFVSNQTGAERCAVIAVDEAGKRTFYGDETSSASGDYERLFDDDFWNEYLPQLQHSEAQIIEYESAWIALTPIRPTAVLLAFVVNDAPISHSPINPETQDLISACCALLGTLIAHKRAEFGWVEERGRLRDVDPLRDSHNGNGPTHTSSPQTDSAIRAQVVAAETLLQSEDRYRSLVELSPDGIAVYQAGAFVYANKALYRLLGALESVGLNVQQVRDAIHPAYLELIRTELMLALEQSRRSQLLQAKLIRMNQAIIDVEIMAAPIIFAGNDALQIIIRDVTERKRAEETRHEAEHLRIALEKERELSELKTRLMTTISHEFRTPLSIVNASAELLDKYLERMTPEQRARHLLKIQSQIRRLTNMMEDITLVVQSNFERVVPQFEPTDFRGLCADAAQQIQVLFQTQDRVVVEIDDGLPKLMLDQRRMTYVLINLLSNALKYSPASSSILLEAQREGQFALVRVTDHGIGIPASEQTHIFEPFYRAQNVSGIGGTGLGLSVVKDIVELHSGTIGLTSELGQGTQITIHLPLRANQILANSSSEASA